MNPMLNFTFMYYLSLILIPILLIFITILLVINRNIRYTVIRSVDFLSIDDIRKGGDTYDKANLN